jgi:hypothetical protein
MTTIQNTIAKLAKHLPLLTVLAVMFLSAPLVEAQAATTNRVDVAWDASTSPDVTNYTVYYGPSTGVYTNTVNSVGTNLTASVTNLLNGGTYFFACTAKDRFGLESDKSNEISYTVPRLKPPPPINFRRTFP